MAFKSVEDRLDEHAALIGQLIVASQVALQRLDRLEAEWAREREHAAKERENAALERENAALERENAAKERENDVKERENAAKERENTVFERENAALERENAAKDRAAMNKRWGEITMKMGTFVEDIIAPNIPRIGRELFGLGEVELSAPRLQKRHSTDPSLREEFDYVYVTPEGWIVNETKTSPRISHVDDFMARLDRLPGFFPEYRDLTLYPCFSSLYLGPDIVNYCTKHGIYALALGDETVEVLNYDQLRSRPA